MRRRRAILVLICGTAVFAFLATLVPSALEQGWSVFEKSHSTPSANQDASLVTARAALETLAVKGRASKTGYARDQFGKGWKEVNGCSTRQIILYRDLTDVVMGDECTVISGTLHDPYTGKVIFYTKQDSSTVQIDHVVALSDTWQKGAQLLSPDQREQLANDPLELLAVDGPANQQKGDGDAASWLPSNKSFRCTYIERQIQVKKKYSLWVTDAERAAMKSVLDGC